MFLRESDPFMPILPSPERQEEFLEEGLKTPPSSLILSSEGNPPRKRSRPNTVAALLDSNPAKRPDTPITTDNTYSGVHPILLVRPVRLPVGTEPATLNPPSLLQIVSHPTPELVRKLTNSGISYVNSPVCQKYKK